MLGWALGKNSRGRGITVEPSVQHGSQAMKPSTLCLALFLCGFVECRTCTAEAQPARVEAAQLCAVKASLRRCSSWSPRMCERVASSLNATPDPVLFAAMMVNESDACEGAVVEPKPGVRDVGMMQIRCVLDHRDRCMNAPVIGLHWTRLADPEVNISAAVDVYRMHGGDLRGYSGSTKERGYGARIMALVAAFGGELRIPKGASGKKWARVRELCRRITEALKGERKS